MTGRHTGGWISHRMPCVKYISPSMQELVEQRQNLRALWNEKETSWAGRKILCTTKQFKYSVLIRVASSGKKAWHLHSFNYFRLYDENSRWQADPSLPPALTLVSCLTYSSTLKMKVICSSETLVDFQRTTRRYIPEYSTLQDEMRLEMIILGINYTYKV
jgi:hypothetical protein